MLLVAIPQRQLHRPARRLGGSFISDRHFQATRVTTIDLTMIDPPSLGFYARR
jgi:hypothetical protein